MTKTNSNLKFQSMTNWKMMISTWETTTKRKKMTVTNSIRRSSADSDSASKTKKN